MNIKKLLQTMAITSATFLGSTLPAFAQTTAPTPLAPPTTDTPAQVATSAQNVLTEISAVLPLAAIQGLIIFGIVVIIIVKAVKHAHNQKTSDIWKTVAFGLAGIIVVADPIIILNIALWFISFFQ